jgi:outer membrane protein TolC
MNETALLSAASDVLHACSDWESCECVHDGLYGWSKYRRPAAPVPQSFKEAPPSGWKDAQPNEGLLRGKWWEVYEDARLNALEGQINISNQNVLAAFAHYQQARDTIRIARSNYYPTIIATPGVINAQTSPALTAKNLVNFVPGTDTEKLACWDEW